MRARFVAMTTGAVVLGVALGLLLRLAGVAERERHSASEPMKATAPASLGAADRQRPVVVTGDGKAGEGEPEARNPLMDMPRDEWHPRDQAEWQGMPVNMAVRQYCEATDYCGLALACGDDNLCGPCARDSQCAAGEACVLDRCVIADRAECRTRRDCAHLGDEALCLLSGITGGDERGNADMRSYCQLPVGGREQVADAERAAERAALLSGEQIHPEVTSDRLFEMLRAAQPEPAR